MSIAIGEDRHALADAVRRFSTQHCGAEVARAAMEPDGDPLPPFWPALSGLGWLGVALPEEAGGEGYGVGELAIVLEELGRSVAPGPALATTWAATVLALATPDDQLRAWLAELAAGRTIGAVALHASVAVDTFADDSVVAAGGSDVVSGATGPILSGSVADLIVVEVSGTAGSRWGVVAAEHAHVVELDSLDATRTLARWDLDSAPVHWLDEVSTAAVRSIGTALAAAEAAGVAAWCVQTAAAHATVRRQFGRPIGQFQAVKHRCADMAVHLEQVRSLAWDAANALDGADPHGPGAQIAVAAAGAIALDATVSVAKDCIQVLGGIGFTWEHDAHLYLRRATAMRQLLGDGAAWRAELARSAVGGTRRHLTVELPPEAEDLRAAIRSEVTTIAELDKQDRRAALAEAGLIVAHWAPPWGRSASPVEQLVIDQELRAARVRVPHLQVGAWAAPTVAAHGTEEQQERWVRPTLHGTISWCQLFSEPEAGSDLAALRTTASQVEGGWSLSGQKVWTTMATEADWGICLARTNPAAPKHLGITYFIVDMTSAGLDIRPLREMTGLEMFNEVFLDEVFVPDDCVVGAVDGGWALARTTLANERVSMGSGSSFGGGIEALVGLVAERFGDGAPAGDPPSADDPLVLDQLGGLVAEAHSIAVMGLRSTMRSVAGDGPGAEASVRKLLGAEHDQRTQELGLGLLGPEGATTLGPAAQWTFGFLANRCLTIAGGTSEIQRNVIGERLLGLPRDPEPGG